MFILKATVFLIACNCLLVIDGNFLIEEISDLRRCLGFVAATNLYQNDVVMMINLMDDLRDEKLLPILPVMQYDPYKLAKGFTWVRPHVYIITLGSNHNLENFLSAMVKTSYWNPRAKVLLVEEGNVNGTFELLYEHHMHNVVVFSKLGLEVIELLSYFPFQGSGKNVTPFVMDKCVRGFPQKGVDLFPNKLPVKFFLHFIKTTYNVNQICHHV